MSIVRGIITVLGIARDINDEFRREKAREQAKLAPKRKKQSEIYQSASQNAGKEPK